MKVKVIKIKTKNPAAYLMNKYRAIVTEHINGTLHIIAVNSRNYPAVMATVDQLYEDLQQLQMIGLISAREYDTAAAIAFDVICGDSDTQLSLPDVCVVRNEHGERICTLNEFQCVIRDAIAQPVNQCLSWLVQTTESQWQEDGWDTEEEYHQCLCKTSHNLMRLGKIVGITSEKDHRRVTEHIKWCLKEKQFIKITLGDIRMAAGE